ncbi:hypothetical protein F53441_65 [Fusarium austroafricanum]|uniref:Uncharacterized protein n=1 Tax=Fusarium austroafricanum TaxID=2364996 RepID=A0A8H4P3U5_9HYPO|nr:hypothetical protein F53441_65 [Fusarium austroafricanum]
MGSSQRLTQIYYNASLSSFEPVTSSSTDAKTLSEEHFHFQEVLLQHCPEHLWHNGSCTAGCPRPILLGRHHQKQLHDLHEALTIAIAGVLDCWWTDKDSRLWERMPLEKDEEDLLTWLNEQVATGNLPKFSQRVGSWRPNFLVEDNDHAEKTYKITEINARYSFSGFLHESYGQNAMNSLIQEKSALLSGATDPETIMNGLFEHFDPRKPLHLLKGAEKGIDLHMFADAVKSRFGMKPCFITPESLRILPDDK